MSNDLSLWWVVPESSFSDDPMNSVCSSFPNQAVKTAIKATVVNAADIFTALYDAAVANDDAGDDSADDVGDVMATDSINVLADGDDVDV